MRKLVILALISFAAAGCAVGRDEVIFLTKTNVALDFDASPPSADIGYKRIELVIEPVDKDGNVLPVLTTVGTRPGFFNWGANHSFATGDAALVLAKYYLTNQDLDLSAADEKLTLANLKSIGKDDNQIAGASGDREGFVFGTNTVFGLGVSWNTSSVPQSIALGYKRKELAVVPLRNVGNGKVKLVSTIATAQAASSVGTPTDTHLDVEQSFATGFAATLLAAHPQLRRALGKVIVPKGEEADKLKRQAAGQLSREEMVDDIDNEFVAGGAARRQDIVAKAVADHVVPAGTTVEAFQLALESVVKQPDPDGNLGKLHGEVTGN